MRLHFGSKRGPICVPLGHLPWAGTRRLGTRGHYDHPLIPRSYRAHTALIPNLPQNGPLCGPGRDWRVAACSATKLGGYRAGWVVKRCAWPPQGEDWGGGGGWEGMGGMGGRGWGGWGDWRGMGRDGRGMGGEWGGMGGGWGGMGGGIGRDKGPLGTPWEAREGILKGPFGAPWGAPAGLPRQSPDSNPQTHRQYSPRGVKKARSYRAHTARIQFLGVFVFRSHRAHTNIQGFPRSRASNTRQRQ